MKTAAQIQKQIDGIEKQKLFLPPFSLFGVPNHRCFDMQIKVLKQEVNVDDLDRDDFEEEEYEVYTSAHEANDWLNDDYEGNLYETN